MIWFQNPWHSVQKNSDIAWYYAESFSINLFALLVYQDTSFLLNEKPSLKKD
jgi:hypothetical protein